MTDQKQESTEPAFSRSRVEQDVIEAYEAFGTERFIEHTTRHARGDMTATCNCPKELTSLGGTHSGLDNVIAALRAFMTEFQVLAVAVDDIVADGAHIVVNYTLSLRHIGAGRQGYVSGVTHYVLDNERKIARCNIFLDAASLGALGDLIGNFAETTRKRDKPFRRWSIPESD